MNIVYLPYEKKMPDFQFRDHCIKLLQEGIRSETQQSKRLGEQEKATYSLPYPVVSVYDIMNGIPIETCRKIGKAGINEGFAFANGIRTNEELNRDWGVPFWNSTFEDPKKCEKRGLVQGDLGLASYTILHDFPKQDGTMFNQIQAVIDQIKELPHLKTHTMTTLYPPGIFRGKGKRQMVVTVPCWGTVINILIMDGKLYISIVMRSTDMVVGEPHDRLMFSAFWLAFCHVLGYEPGKMSIVYLNAHYYENQRSVLEKIVSRYPRPFPEISLNNPPDDFFAFRKEHFEITDYNPHPAIAGIPVSP